MTEAFKTVVFRVDPALRTAVPDGGACVLHYGDSLKLVFAGVPGLDLASSEAGLVSAASPYGMASAQTAAPAFQGTRTDAAVYSLSLLTAEAEALCAAVPPGTGVPLRLYLTDKNRTWVDIEVRIFPQPLVGATQASAGSSAVRGAQLAAIAAEVAALPSLCRGSALRFLLTRLVDWLNVPPGALVKPLDPLEYDRRLVIHQRIADAREYGLKR